jgi:hypothetical protein
MEKINNANKKVQQESSSSSSSGSSSGDSSDDSDDSESAKNKKGDLVTTWAQVNQEHDHDFFSIDISNNLGRGMPLSST